MLDSLMHKSFKKRRVRTQKLMYTKEIRLLIGKKKSMKRLLKSAGIDNDISAKDYINLKVKRLGHKIDKAIADYNNSFVMSMVNG